MIRHRLALTTAGCLLFLAGIAHGGPAADESAVPAPSPADEVWGDPEAAEASESGWTWFGMGYERRNRERIERTTGSAIVPDDSGRPSGKERSGK